ncbi:MAG TPA: amidohydrolase family protein [Acidobacteriota bacterium]|nr:amidohydrolase family protein [Acidobacteriota bacterium]
MKSVERFSVWTIVLLLIAGSALAQRDDKKEKKDLPLEPVRQVEFTTDEVTWMSLDVSPDGQNIVFELVGDLYSVPIEGGTAQRLTEGMGFDSQPRYSPDGKWIAFISDRDGAENLWVAQADGSDPRQLSKEKSNSIISPAWMPDSQYVLVTKSDRGVDIYMYHVNGGSGIKVTGDEEDDDGPGGGGRGGDRKMGAAVSPDGRFLYYAQRGGGSVYNQMSFDWEIHRRDMISGESDRVTQAQGGAFRPLISPDGKHLVYGTRYEAETGLRIRNLDSGQDRWLKYPVQRDDMESRGSRDLFPSYAFTPDGDSLIVTYDGKIHRIDISSGDSSEIAFSADVSLDIGPRLNFQRKIGDGPVRSRLIFDPVQSPEGERIVFSAMGHLYEMNLEEKTPRRLTQDNANEFKPSFSPDGQWIVYVTWIADGTGHIWKRPAAGGTPQRLTQTPAFYTDPVFSPDGSRIVARRGNAWMRTQTPSEFGGLRISLDLVWLPSEGGQVQLIVPARGLGVPHFGPEDDRVYFYSRDGLVSMRYDGTDRRNHLKVTGRSTPRSRRPPAAQDVRISPDGRWALARVNHQLYVTAVPPPTGSAPSINVDSGTLPAKRLTDVGADSYQWADQGKTVTWSMGSTFFRRPFDSIDFSPKKDDEEDDQAEEEGDDESDAEETPEEGEENQDAEADDGQNEEEKFEAKEEDENVESYEVVIEFPRHKPEGTVVLRGATVITMNGDEVLEDADILIEDNRIKAVGKDLQVPSQARVFDLAGKYVVPGFIDTHAHYEMRTEGVLELHNWSFLANLAYGVTTGLDVQTSTNDYLAYLDMVQAGIMLGPRAHSTGPGVFSNTNFQDYESAYHVLERYKRYYRNNNLKSYVVGNRKQRQWVVKAANELEMTVTTEGALDLKLDMTHAIDGFGGNEHSLPIVPLFKDVVELFAQTRCAYTPTLLVLYGGPWAENYFYTTTEVHDDAKINRFVPHNEIDRLTKRRPWFREDEHAFPRHAAAAAQVQRAGGLVGVGGHGQLQGLGYHWEMWSLGMGGMTPREVLKAATIDGAEIVGLQQDLGSITEGKLADLVILDQDPLQDIRNTNSVRWVMKNGELFEGDTLKKIYPQEEEVAPFWWWNADPSDED